MRLGSNHVEGQSAARDGLAVDRHGGRRDDQLAGSPGREAVTIGMTKAGLLSNPAVENERRRLIMRLVAIGDDARNPGARPRGRGRRILHVANLDDVVDAFADKDLVGTRFNRDFRTASARRRAARTSTSAATARPIVAWEVCRITNPSPRELCRAHGPSSCGLVRAFPAAARGPCAARLRSGRARPAAVAASVSAHRTFWTRPDSSVRPVLSSAVPSSRLRLSADLSSPGPSSADPSVLLLLVFVFLVLILFLLIFVFLVLFLLFLVILVLLRLRLLDFLEDLTRLLGGRDRQPEHSSV